MKISKRTRVPLSREDEAAAVRLDKITSRGKVESAGHASKEELHEPRKRKRIFRAAP